MLGTFLGTPLDKRRRRALQRFSLTKVFLFFLLCRSAPVSCNPHEPRRSPGGAATAGAETGPRLEADAGAPDSSVRSVDLEPVFDFSENLGLAHIRSGGLLIDFGTPDRYKYTLGDWKSGWGGDFLEDGTTFSHMTKDRAEIFFDALPEEAGGGEIIVRSRADQCRVVDVALNGVHLGHARAGAGGFEVSSVRFDKEIQPGLNTLGFRCLQYARAERDARAKLSVDYVSVVSESMVSADMATRSDRMLAEPAGCGMKSLLLVSGDSLAYNLPMTREMRLLGTAVSRSFPTRARLQVAIRRDGAPEVPVAELEFGAKAVPVDVPIGKKAGDSPASVVFRASEGTVELSGLRLALPEPQTPAMTERPEVQNVVLLLVDTLRADRLRLFNPGSRVKTPGLDAIGGESIVFSRATAPYNWTKPSVATLLTGLYPEAHGTNTHKAILPAHVGLFSEHLSNRGFVTAAFVGNGYISEEFGFNKGWDHWRSYGKKGPQADARFIIGDAARWLAAQPRDRRFFLYVHAIDPHAPYAAPKRYWSPYDPDTYHGPVEPRQTAALLRRIRDQGVELADRDRSRLEALYDGEISYWDFHLQRLVRALAKRRLLGNTVVIVTSDHGEEFFDHGSVGHGHTLYEELIHVPLVVRLPGGAGMPGRRYDEEVELVDVVPTLCDLLAVPCPAEVQGRSLVPMWLGPGRARFPGAAFSDFAQSGQKAVRIGRFKAIYTGPVPALFDLERDPKEFVDRRLEYPVALAMLQDSLGAHLGRFAVAKRGELEKDKGAHGGQEAVISPETVNQLRALGYMDN